jgi:hypothetical protein
MQKSVVVENLDLAGLPEHLHEWARNLETEADRHQREANNMEHQARALAVRFLTKSILGDQNE